MNKIGVAISHRSIKLLKYIFSLYIIFITLLASALYIFSTITNWFSLKGGICDIIMYYWIYPICILSGVFIKIYTKQNNNKIVCEDAVLVQNGIHRPGDLGSRT